MLVMEQVTLLVPYLKQKAGKESSALKPCSNLTMKQAGAAVDNQATYLSKRALPHHAKHLEV